MSKYVLAGLFVCIAACNTPTVKKTKPQTFYKDSLAADIKMLSSDSFMGRKPFTVGEDRTVDYLQKKFASMGIEPGNGNSYVQEVPLVEITPTADATMKVQAGKKTFTLKNGDDYVVATERTDSIISLKNDSLVFAGFGIVAPEYNWNDYDSIDVKGKVVLVMVNDPGFGSNDTALFKGNTMTYYGRWTYKYEEAARQGARACLIIHNTEAASYPFSVVQNSWGSSNLYLDSKDTTVNHLALQGWVTESTAMKLLKAAGKDSTLLDSAHHRGFKAVPLHERLTTNVKVKAVHNTSKNVIAKITGTKTPNEYVIYTAHWDHLGVGKPDSKGDSIYNGAVDNASGTAALLEIARSFKNAKVAPDRTVLFLSVTAEEQGLLGSAYYAQHPVYPLAQTVAEINMDGLNVFGKTKDVVITGQGQSDLEDYLANEAKIQGRYIEAETHPEAGHYFRSDHFNFAKVGVPALNASSGVDYEGKGKAYGQQLEEDYTANRYHQPGDQFDSTWTFEGALQDLEMLYNVGKQLSNSSEWPSWKDGSEFKARRAPRK